MTYVTSEVGTYLVADCAECLEPTTLEVILGDGTRFHLCTECAMRLVDTLRGKHVVRVDGVETPWRNP
jgi:hypothetical protein